MVKLIKSPLFYVPVGWCIFILVAMSVVSGGRSVANSAEKSVPDVVDMGLGYALKNVLKPAGFLSIPIHDATGRFRSIGDERNWLVCVQTPVSGGQLPRNRKITLAAVRIGEGCPVDASKSDPKAPGKPLREDRSIATHPEKDQAMPQFWRKSAQQVVDSLGTNASLRFYERGTRRLVTRGLGDWLVCTQEIPASQPFNGRPVRFEVLRYANDDEYDSRCPSTAVFPQAFYGD